MAERKIGLGILGLGRSGWNIHAKGVTGHPLFSVAAVADPVEERRQEAVDNFGCTAYEEPQGVITDPNVEVVVVATPSHTHVPLTLEALESGKHVIVEKPMAEKVSDIDTMIAKAKETGRFVTCYQPRRFDAEFLAIRSLIDEGRLGRVVMVRRTAHGFQRRADWQMLRKYGGGELSNTGPHLIDQVLQLVGEGDLDIFSDLQHTVGAGDAEDHVKVVLKSESGVTADVEITRCSAFTQDPWFIMGTQGAVTGSTKELRVKWYDPSTLGELVLDEGPAAGRRYGTGETIEWHEEVITPKNETPQVVQFYNAFYETIVNGAPLFVTPESIRTQIDVIDRARKAADFA